MFDFSRMIGIDASRAFVKTKTGIEEYSYRVIKGLTDCLRDQRVVLYLDPRVNKLAYIDFDLPENWKTKFISAPKFWTQVRLSLEMIFHPVDVLFVPAHTVPIIHPKNTVVTIHGLEYEFCPRAYSWFERLYMRWSIRRSCKWAQRIIAVSQNTKNDLKKLYKVPPEKVEVIYEGISESSQSPAFPFLEQSSRNSSKPDFSKYLLFIGRLEDRKNILGMVEAFERLKEKYKISHKLILVGKYGYGGEKIKNKVYSSVYKNDIILTGYISDEEKFYLLKSADVFLFPTFYEGFGLPILEAQSVGTPVITSNISSMPEVAGNSAVLVDPKGSEAIAEAAYKLISDESYKNDIIEKGYNNIKRFDWQKCAEEVSNLLRN
ncbi:MAG TPA: glycosyltransferase family 1 protein [Candidatus Bathyarchaeia archaeon]|nr:glycosyltransferase family 1 protein [Candidatus Bathyarchaeia archaeon]